MKILIPLAVNFGKHGGFRVLSKLADNWLALGHDVEFLVHVSSPKPYFPTNAKIRYYDLTGKILENNKSLVGNLSLGVFGLRYALRKALEKEWADVVLATQNFSVDPIYLSGIGGKKFYYIQAYEPEFYNQGPFWYKLYKNIAVNSYKRNFIKIVNSNMYKSYKEIQTDKVVFPGLDLKNFYPRKSIIKKEPMIVGTIGRTEEWKGTKYILQAFRLLKEKYADKIILNCAFGDLDWAKQDKIQMVFPKNDSQLADYYRTLDVYVCAGTIQLDAVHYPVIESMACNIPIVTTGYYPANEENAYIIPTKNAEAIAEAISKIYENYSRATDKADIAYQQVEEFEWKNVAQRMLNYFKSND